MQKNAATFILLLASMFVFAQAQQKEIKSELQELFGPEFDALEPGGAIIVKKGNRIVYQQNFGLANLETKEKITENTIFNTGSISKTFVSNGILILQERGALSIENNISEYFDDFDHPEIWGQTKIKHLLSHNSGLPDLRKVSKNETFYLTAKDAGNFEPIKQAEKLNFLSGEKFEYSNPAFNGLALIIEKLTKEKWQKFIKENIFDTSNMLNSKITDGAYPQNEVAHGYELVNNKYVESDYGEVPTFAAAGNGGVWSTVLDLTKYEKAIQENKFLNQASIDRSRSIYKPTNWKSSIQPKIGYGWFITTKEQSRYQMDMISHTGSQGGFSSFYYYFPSKDLLFVGLFNRPLGTTWEKVNATFDVFKEHNWFD